MIFDATNSPSGVLIQGKIASDVINLTGQNTNSSGKAIVDQNTNIYLPNNIDDLKGIISELKEVISVVKDLATTISTIPPSNAGGVVCATCGVDGPLAITNLVLIEEKVNLVEELLK